MFTLLRKQSRARQGGARARARAVDLPARSFDVARPGVASPLVPKCRCLCRLSVSIRLLVCLPVFEDLIACESGTKESRRLYVLVRMYHVFL